MYSPHFIIGSPYSAWEKGLNGVRRSVPPSPPRTTQSSAFRGAFLLPAYLPTKIEVLAQPWSGFPVVAWIVDAWNRKRTVQLPAVTHGASDLVGLCSCCDGRADLGVRFPLEVARCTELLCALVFGDEKFRYLVDY